MSVIIALVLVMPWKGIGSQRDGMLVSQPASMATMTYDVVVYGGTSGGVMAAVAAKRHGQSVLLIEPGRRLGGMTSSGLGYTDVGDERTVTGLAREFYRRIGYYYGKASRDSIANVLKNHGRGGWKYYKGVPEQAWNSGDGAGEGWTFEPHVAEQIFQSFVDEADIEVLYSRKLTKVKKQGTKIKQITLTYDGEGAGGGDLTVAAKVFIDASYEGDLMARAGVSFTVGREDNKTFNENYNGVQVAKTKGTPGNVRIISEYPKGTDPYVKKGEPDSGLLPGIQHKGLAPTGTGDKKVQAYNFRMTLCRGNRMQPLEKPEGHVANRYKLLVRMMQVSPWKNLRTGFTISPLPNGATDWNNKGGYGFSTDYIGGSYA